MSKISAPDFFEIIIEKYPEIKFEILDDKGLPHLQMSVIARYARQLFEQKNQSKLIELIEFIEGNIPNADDHLYNMIGVSFVENLVFHYDKGKKRNEIIKLLPEEMTSMYESLKPIFDKE